MEKSQVEGIESCYRQYAALFWRLGFMEKSQVEGIESSHVEFRPSFADMRFMEKSQVEGIERCSEARWNHVHHKIHGEIPSRGNWKLGGQLSISKDFLEGFMEKSQVEGIESRAQATDGYSFHQTIHGEIPSRGNWKRVQNADLPGLQEPIHGEIPSRGNWKKATLILKQPCFEKDSWRNPK